MLIENGPSKKNGILFARIGSDSEANPRRWLVLAKHLVTLMKLLLIEKKIMRFWLEEFLTESLRGFLQTMRLSM